MSNRCKFQIRGESARVIQLLTVMQGRKNADAVLRNGRYDVTRGGPTSRNLWHGNAFGNAREGSPGNLPLKHRVDLGDAPLRYSLRVSTGSKLRAHYAALTAYVRECHGRRYLLRLLSAVMDAARVGALGRSRYRNLRFEWTHREGLPAMAFIKNAGTPKYVRDEIFMTVL